MSYLALKSAIGRRITRFNSFVIAIFLAANLITSVDADGQVKDISGTAWLSDWPASRVDIETGERAEPIDFTRYKLLPFIDSLAVHYRFSIPESNAETLSMHFAIEWTEGEGGVLNRRKVGIDEMPPRVVFESVDILLNVLVDNAPVAEFYLPLDTIGLAPVPSMTFVDIDDVAWEDLFENIDAGQARQIFESGFELASPRIVSATFYAEPSDGLVAHKGDTVDRTVFIPNVDIWINWGTRRGRFIPPPGAVRQSGGSVPRESGRSKLTGRSRTSRGGDRDVADSSGERNVSDRSAEGSRGSRNNGSGRQRGRDPGAEKTKGGGLGNIFNGSKDDDDDDDEDRLLPAALAGAVAVAGLAVLGGTFGYFGSVSKAPIGFMSGYVERDSGLLLQVAVNTEVFGEKNGAENLIASLTAFHNLFNSRLQPALGLGTRVTEEGTEDLKFEPSIALGFVGNFGRFIVHAGYDVTTPDFRVGIGVNFRHEP